MPVSLERMMKHKQWLIFLFLSLFLFTGTNCMSPTFRTVMVMENFTSTWVNRKPISDAIYEFYQEHSRVQVVLIRYYVDSTADLPYPRLACKESEDRMKWCMTDKGLQTTFFNGTEYVKGVPNPHDETEEGHKKAFKEILEKKVKEINARFPPVSIAVSCKKSETEDDFAIEVSVQAIGQISSTTLQLNIALVESNIPYVAINGETLHFQVFREWIKPPEFNESIGIPISIKEFGDEYETQFTYHLNSELFKNNLSIVLFVQDMKTKAIFQGMQINLS
jgi:hypothetical protein